MRGACLVSMVAILAVATPVFAQTPGGHLGPTGHGATATSPATYSAAQFFETTSYSLSGNAGFPYAHDGGSLLINSDASGVFNTYALPLAGGEPVALTRSTANAAFGVSYFPGDGRVLYTSDEGGNELNHIYVRAEDGTVTDLTPGDQVRAQFFGWSADGRTIYLLTNARDPAAFDLMAVDAETYQSRMLFQNDGGFYPSTVSRDGRWLALDKPITSANSDIYLADLTAGGAPRLVTEHQGNIAYSTYDFTPDSRSLVYATDEYGEFNQAWALDLESGARAPVVQADWDVAFLFFSPTGRYRISAVNADGSTQLTIFDTRMGRPVPLTGVPAGSLAQVRFNEQETTVSFSVSSDTSPADVFVADVASGVARRMTRALNSAIRESDLVEATVIGYPGAEEVAIPGILYRPHGASADKPVPAVVLMHGGPGGQSTRGYDPEVQHLVNHGYAVLLANNRGSSGYGKTFFHLDDRKHGEGDLQDVVDAGAWLRAQDWVAADQVAVMGGSYGGYLTAAALAFHPEAFEAGINIFGVTNWVRTLKSIPPWWGAQKDALYDEMGDPATDEERHRRISPLFHASNIARPILVVQGANDPRVLQVESDELVAAIRANNVPVEYVLFPDEGHGFLRRENRITAQEAYLAFLEQYVRD